MKLTFYTLLLVSLLLTSSFLQFSNADAVCDSKCKVRCAKAGYKDRCLKYCGICCQKCEYCVPSGTYGNKDECPCYRDMKTSNGKPKCP
ncbi:Gibberellin-regulated protein [Thalictrum thalictroides]|uniref:Gibberellin-regulated protein n=1 Tax=Thalictrum thalictroides TaxID=46969 RepID=A0A7J6WY63_THATH|nr:Gibberellin-regulated protein [Thalictrum thalictroides]